MKGFLAVVLLVAAVAAENLCPPNQGEEDVLLAHPDCDKFYKCTHGAPVEQNCYAGLHFDVATLQCNWRDEVDCKGRNDPSVETPEEKDEEDPDQIVVVDPPQPESESEEGDQPQPESESEEGDQIIVVELPEPEEEAGKPEEIIVVNPESEEQQVKPESEEEAENSREEVNVVPSPESVEQAPKESSEQASKESSEQSSSESSEQSSSESAEQAPEESAEQAPESAEQKPEIELLENGCPVDPHVHKLLSHEEDCNKFYYCIAGEKLLRECSSTLHFNYDKQVCDYPWRAGCAQEESFNKHMRAIYSSLRDRS